jgi:LruC domain-containing protein
LDPEVAFQVRTPASGQYTVAFEDLYPVPGDADYNDFVAEYFVLENYKSQVIKEELQEAAQEVVLDGPIEVMLMNLHGESTAISKVAGYSHKFGIVIDFPGHVATSVKRVYYDAYGNRQVDSQSNVADRAVIWLFENTSRPVIGKTATFDILFPKGITRSMVSIAPYDPVLYVHNTGKDIHLVGQDSLSGQELSYMDPNGYPWALLVPEDWQPPAETQYIGKAYPLFDEWRASKGAVAPYWYLYPASTGSVPGNKPPYPVTAPTANPQLVAGSASSQEFQLSFTDPKADPDGDTVQFMSSPAPMALQDLFSLNAGTGLVKFAPGVPEGDYLFYFWSVDEHGASTIATPFKATFSFRKKAATGYPRIVIETFSPNGSFTADTFIDLFGANGDPDADNPWTGDDTGDALAWDDNGSTNWANMSLIDYTKGLNPGTYYIRVRGNVEAFDEWYAIRVLSLNVGDSLPAYPILPLASKPDSVDLVGTGDDNPQSGGIPANPVEIGLGAAGALSRSLDYDGAGDIDWFKLVLQ